MLNLCEMGCLLLLAVSRTSILRVCACVLQTFLLGEPCARVLCSGSGPDV
jgi:hypothetical protein